MDNQHFYVCGKSGSGKSTYLKNEFLRELESDRPLFFIDPHGPDALDLLAAIPPHRARTSCYIDLSDYHYAVGFNPLSEPQHLITAFKSIWAESWGPRLEWFLFNGLALLHEIDGNLKDLPRLYYDKTYRTRVMPKVKNPATRQFWLKEYPAYNDRYREDAMGPILNKIGQFLASSVHQNLTQTKPRYSLELALSANFVTIINLAKGHVGDSAAFLFGSLFTTTLRNTLMLNPTPCSFYADEFQNYGSDIYISMLSELRKFGLRLGLAHQFASQIEPRLLHAILGNVRDIVVFAVSHDDAQLLAPHFNRDHQKFNADALTTLPPFHAIINGYPEQLPPYEPQRGSITAIIEQSRRRFARSV